MVLRDLMIALAIMSIFILACSFVFLESNQPMNKDLQELKDKAQETLNEKNKNIFESIWKLVSYIPSVFTVGIQAISYVIDVFVGFVDFLTNALPRLIGLLPSSIQVFLYSLMGLVSGYLGIRLLNAIKGWRL